MLASRATFYPRDSASPSLQALNAAAELAHDLRMRAIHEDNVWIAKRMWVWNPTSGIEFRCRDGEQGLLLNADVAPTPSGGVLRLYLGLDRGRADMCALWQGEKCVIWNTSFGFCSVWPTAKQYEDFSAWVKPLIRRNCFLLGAHVEANSEEKRQWVRWLIDQMKLARTQLSRRGGQPQCFQSERNSKGEEFIYE